VKTILRKNHRILFYSSWIILGLIQCRYTELLDDEAYYWVYSKFLDWGYFDHPPMVALLIRAGYFLFHSELGVRLFFLLLNALSLVIIERLIDKKNVFLFYAIAMSLAILLLGGFFAVPDTPLIFFTALFFLCYKQFLQRQSFLHTLLMALVTAALLYSKYHVVLIVFFTLLSNPKLLTRYQTYIAGLIAFLIFIPHLYWQYQHDWISFRYHLFESNVNPYKISHTLDYIAGQILLAGPLAGFVLLPAAIMYRTKNFLERGLKFTMVGIYVFFFLSSFKGLVEANWTSPCIIPLIILSHNFLAERSNWRKWLLRLLPATMVLVLFARIAMILDFFPANAVKERFHSWKDWPRAMEQKTHGLPIVFENSYQRASKYWFYSGQMTYSLNWYRERRNNYNFWPIEDSLLGKAVYILDKYNLDSFADKMQTPIGLVGYRYDSSFSSFAKVQFIPDKKEIYGKENSSFSMNIKVTLTPEYSTYINSHPELQIKIVLGIFDKNGWLKDLPVLNSLQDLIRQPTNLQFDPQLPKGKYYLIFSILHVGTITSSHNSSKIKLVIN